MNIYYTGFDNKYIKDLVRFHRISFKDHFNSRLGNKYAKDFISWFANQDNGNIIFICAVDKGNDKAIGYICGGPDGYSAQMNKNLFFTIIISFLLRPWLIFDKRFFELFLPKLNSLLGRKEYPKFQEFEKRLPQPIFSVTSFALDNKLRDAGFGIFLLENLFKEFLNKVKEKNAGTVRATIRSFNKEIFKYYKMKKWIPAPFTEKDKTICFYKELKSS